MATKRTNKKNVTKVICQNCGAEVIIPEHECQVIGTVIGKDSGLGTVVLPTKNGAPKLPNEAELISALLEGNPEIVALVTNVIGSIEDSGYLDVDGIVRRWIPSQCLTMMFSRNGFHEELKMRGYDYSWKVLVDEVKRQSELYYKKDIEGLSDRCRWYNSETAYMMAKHYFNELQCKVSSMHPYSHKNRPYVKLQCRWMNNGKGVHVDELSVFFATFEKAMNRIKGTKNPKTLCEAVLEFNRLRTGVKFNPSNLCPAFTNAYKAAGAYYTIKDLIMFENCRMQLNERGTTDAPTYWDRKNGQKRKFVETEESLEALERKASAIVSDGVIDWGYQMLGLLKEFLDYNHFNFEATKQKWYKQSELRKAIRMSHRGNRRSRK